MSVSKISKYGSSLILWKEEANSLIHPQKNPLSGSLFVLVRILLHSFVAAVCGVQAWLGAIISDGPVWKTSLSLPILDSRCLRPCQATVKASSSHCVKMDVTCPCPPPHTICKKVWSLIYAGFRRMFSTGFTAFHPRSFHLPMTVSITLVRPSISSSAVKLDRSMLQPTYTGSMVFRARILATLLAKSTVELDE